MENYEVVAAGSISFPAGVPTFTFQRGCVGASLARSVGIPAGDLVLTLDGGGVDIGQCTVETNPRVAYVGSDMANIAVMHTSDTVKRFYTVQEQAGGAASILADVPFDFVIRRVL